MQQLLTKVMLNHLTLYQFQPVINDPLPDIVVALDTYHSSSGRTVMFNSLLANRSGVRMGATVPLNIYDMRTVIVKSIILLSP